MSARRISAGPLQDRRGGYQPPGGFSWGASWAMRPPFSFWLRQKENAPRPVEEKKSLLVATLHVRAKLLYGGRRERVPAGLRWLPDGRGGVRCRLDSGFPRRGCALGRGARRDLTSSSFPVSRCGAPRISVTSVPLVPPSARSASLRAALAVVGADAFIGSSRAGQLAAAKREAIPCDNHPDKVGTPAMGRQLGKSQKAQACPNARKNRSRHWYADPRTRGGPLHRSASKRPFLLDRARPVFFSGKTEKKMGGASPLDKPPAGAEIPEAAATAAHLMLPPLVASPHQIVDGDAV